MLFIELVVSNLRQTPFVVIIGALLGIGLMASAVLFYLTIISVKSQSDEGQLFVLANPELFCCAVIMVLYKNQMADILKKNTIGNEYLTKYIK